MGNKVIGPVGGKLGYAQGSVNGTIPASFTMIVDVIDAPGVEFTQEIGDATPITSRPRIHFAGHTDHTTEGTINLAHTNEAIISYGSALAAYESAAAAGKEFWLEYWYPGASKAYFYTASLGELGTSGLEDGTANIPAPVGILDVKGWETAVEPS